MIVMQKTLTYTFSDHIEKFNVKSNDYKFTFRQNNNYNKSIAIYIMRRALYLL